CHDYHYHRDLRSFPTRRSSDLLGIGVQNFRPVADDPPVLLIHSGEETGHIDKGDDRDIETIAEANKTAQFIRRIDIQAPGHHLRSEEHTSELQSRENLVCRLLL